MSIKKIIFIIFALIMLACISGIVMIYFETEATQDKFKALIDACRGNPVAEAAGYVPGSGVHPGMGVIKRESGTLQIYTYAVPAEALAQSVAETELVLCLTEPKEVLLERCPYVSKKAEEPENVVERYIYEGELSLVEAKTGTVITSEVLQGDEPRECLEQETFLKGQQTIKVNGDKINDAHMHEWLRAYVLVP